MLLKIYLELFSFSLCLAGEEGGGEGQAGGRSVCLGGISLESMSLKVPAVSPGAQAPLSRCSESHAQSPVKEPPRTAREGAQRVWVGRAEEGRAGRPAGT